MADDGKSILGVLTEAANIVADNVNRAHDATVNAAEKVIEEGVEAVHTMTGGMADAASALGDTFIESTARLEDLIGRFHSRPLNKGHMYAEPSELIGCSESEFGDNEVAFEINVSDYSHPHHAGWCGLLADALIAGNPTQVSDSEAHQEEFYKHLSGIRGRSGNAVG